MCYIKYQLEDPIVTKSPIQEISGIKMDIYLRLKKNKNQISLQLRAPAMDTEVKQGICHCDTWKWVWDETRTQGQLISNE